MLMPQRPPPISRFTSRLFLPYEVTFEREFSKIGHRNVVEPMPDNTENGRDTSAVDSLTRPFRKQFPELLVARFTKVGSIIVIYPIVES